MDEKYSETTGKNPVETTGKPTVPRRDYLPSKSYAGKMLRHQGSGKHSTSLQDRPTGRYDKGTLDSIRKELLMERFLILYRCDERLSVLETLGEEIMSKGTLVGGEFGIGKSVDTSTPSSYLAAVGLFTLQKLIHLDMDGPLDDDLECNNDFYKGMCAAASQSKIESFTYWLDGSLGPDASLHFARGLFFMPNLNSFKLRYLKLSDEYYLTMAAEASKSKIESFSYLVNDSLGPDASLHFARGLFSMPNLNSLELDDLELSDEYYLTMAAEASKSKIQHLEMWGVAITQRILHTFLCLKHLKSLKMRRMKFPHKDDEDKLVPQTSSLTELTLYHKDVDGLWNLGLHTSCPQVTKLDIQWNYEEDVSADTVTKACSPFHHLTQLGIHGNGGTVDPESFCSAIITSCRQLSKLFIRSFKLHNEKADVIITLMKTHPNLTNLEFTFCEIDNHLDPLIAEVNSEGKLTVTTFYTLKGNSPPSRRSLITSATSPTIQETSSAETSAQDQDVESGDKVEEEQDKVEESEEGEFGAEVKQQDDVEEDEGQLQEGEDVEQYKGELKEDEDEEEEGSEEKIKDKGGDQQSTSGYFPYEEGEPTVPPIETECCKSVGIEGGRLILKTFGIQLEIPPGAIISKTPQDISLSVLLDTSNLGNNKDEMSVSFGVQCIAPEDLDLQLPVTYTIPHCANISRFSRLEAVLYTGEGKFTPDAVIKDRMVLSSSGIPSCTILKDELKLKMNHFSWAGIKLRFKGFFSQKKKMCCLLFREKILSVKKDVIFHAHLYRNIAGNSEIIKKKENEHEFVSVHPEVKLSVTLTKDDLKMTCVLKGTEFGDSTNVSYERIKNGEDICEPLIFDFTDQPDSFAVSLRVGQNTKLAVTLAFRLNFTGPERSPQNHDQLGASSSVRALPTSHLTEEDTHNEPETSKMTDFDGILETVARSISKDIEISNLGKALGGFSVEDISRYIATNSKGQGVTYDGTLQMLRDWRKRQTKDTERELLKAALNKADQVSLASELFGT